MHDATAGLDNGKAVVVGGAMSHVNRTTPGRVTDGGRIPRGCVRAPRVPNDPHLRPSPLSAQQGVPTVAIRRDVYHTRPA